jgi:hypothetical protein
MTWQIIDMKWLSDPKDEVHVLPINDLIYHEFHSCACLPVPESVQRSDGSYGWLIKHNAWDGRK